MPRRVSPRVGLVLGAGGVMGGAWLTGALEALATETGWDPASAGRIVGTSAGSLMGGLPRVSIPPDPLKDTTRRVAPSGWTDPPSFWALACDYADGHRVAFGREDAPEAALADAVAASCAIPGFYEPVTIAGRRYVDGGLWSTSNLDILRGCALDLVICLNPTSSLHPPHAWNPAERVAASLRT